MPAAAPMMAPMTAPRERLPLLSTRPRMAPPAAAPPMVAASLRVSLRPSPTKEAWIGTVLPDGSTRSVNLRVSFAWPPTLRRGTASPTTPTTSEPAGMTTWPPSEITSDATRARKMSPGSLVWLERLSRNSTRMTVPEGTVATVVTGLAGSRSGSSGAGAGASAISSVSSVGSALSGTGAGAGRSAGAGLGAGFCAIGADRRGAGCVGGVALRLRSRASRSACRCASSRSRASRSAARSGPVSGSTIWTCCCGISGSRVSAEVVSPGAGGGSTMTRSLS